MYIAHDISEEEKIAALRRAYSKVVYPAVVIDVGYTGLKGEFDKAEKSKVHVSEIAWLRLDSVASKPDWGGIEVIDLTESPQPQVLSILENAFVGATIIGHNLGADLQIIDWMRVQTGLAPLAIAEERQFCTMMTGLYFSRVHIYRGGVKVKKYPNLQLLYQYLLGEATYKGDITDDIAQCFACFKALELAVNGRGLRAEKE